MESKVETKLIKVRIELEPSERNHLALHKNRNDKQEYLSNHMGIPASGQYKKLVFYYNDEAIMDNQYDSKRPKICQKFVDHFVEIFNKEQAFLSETVIEVVKETIVNTSYRIYVIK